MTLEIALQIKAPCWWPIVHVVWILLSRWLPTLLPLYTTTRFQSWITSDIVILVIIAILVSFLDLLWEFKWMKSSIIVLVSPFISLHDLKWYNKVTRRERSHLHELLLPRYVLSFSRLFRRFPAKWDAHPNWNVEHFFQKLNAAIVDEKISKTSINWFSKQRKLFSVFCFSHMTGYHSLTFFLKLMYIGTKS